MKMRAEMLGIDEVRQRMRKLYFRIEDQFGVEFMRRICMVFVYFFWLMLALVCVIMYHK